MPLPHCSSTCFCFIRSRLPANVSLYCFLGTFVTEIIDSSLSNKYQLFVKALGLNDACFVIKFAVNQVIYMHLAILI